MLQVLLDVLLNEKSIATIPPSEITTLNVYVRRCYFGPKGIDVFEYIFEITLFNMKQSQIRIY